MRAAPSLWLPWGRSRGAVLIAASAFRTRELGESVDGGAGIGVGDETDAGRDWRCLGMMSGEV
jgi:hypothetical protein